MSCLFPPVSQLLNVTPIGNILLAIASPTLVFMKTYQLWRCGLPTEVISLRSDTLQMEITLDLD